MWVPNPKAEIQEAQSLRLFYSGSRQHHHFEICSDMSDQANYGFAVKPLNLMAIPVFRSL